MAIVMTLLFIMSGLVNQFNAKPGLATHRVAGDQNWIVAQGTGGSPPMPPELKMMTVDEVTADTLLPLDGAISSITLVRVLLWLITVIIIYITALERTRDFAVLKAVGGKTRDLGLSLLVQGVLMTLIAVVLAGILQTFIAPSFPLKVRVPSSAWFTVAGGATVAALAAGAAGVMRVRSTSPAEAFG
jgi:putative ABC transport system permease protein